MRTELCAIMQNEGSDKGGGWHNYTEYYFELFKDFRDKNFNFFELGLGTNNLDVKSNMGSNGIPGASLRGWKKFFTNANIYGADIDDRILIQEDRISTFYCDQTKKESIINLFENDLQGKTFDVILEDGLHEFFANEIFLRNSFKYLNKGGIFIVEDLNTDTVNNFIRIENDLKSELDIEDFKIIDLPNPANNHDNRLLVIKKS